MSAIASSSRRWSHGISVNAVSAEVLGVAALTAIAFALRLSQLHESLAGDEVFTYQDVVGHSFVSVLTTVHAGGENSPPLFFLMAWLSAKLGDPSVWIRVPSLILGTATVPVTYAVGRQSIGARAGLIAAAIMALAPFAVFYGVEARPYAAMTFFVALSTLALLHAVRPGTSRWWWALYTLAAAAAAYSHYTAIFLLLVQAVYSLWACRGAIKTTLIANLAIGVLYLPWLPNVRGKALAVIGALYPLGFHRVLADLLRPIPGHPGVSLHQIPTVLGLIAFAVCVAAGGVALVIKALRADQTGWFGQAGNRAGLIVLLALATPVGLLLYSLIFTDLWLPRGLSASMPAAALLIGGLLAALPARLSALTVAVVAVVLTTGTLRSFEPAYARGPYRAIATRLDRIASSHSPVLVVSLQGALAVPEQTHRPHDFVASLRAMWATTPRGGHAYLVLDDAIDHATKLVARGALHRPGFRLQARRHYAGASPTELLTFVRTGR
ncbi:MAG: glycosyltransferase family 39 protein [Solirubrobacteraceae bacterium]